MQWPDTVAAEAAAGYESFSGLELPCRSEPHASARGVGRARPRWPRSRWRPAVGRAGVG